jgi:Cu-processing system permease protein
MMGKILKYQLRDVLRSKWILAYGLLFLILTDVLFRFGGDGVRVATSLMNVVLIVIPLASTILGAFYLYNTREYIELLLCHPVKRRHLFWGMFLGLSLPMTLAYTAGVVLPFIYHGAGGEAWSAAFALMFTGTALTVIFVGLAYYLALRFDDKIKGLGLALIICLFFTIIYDGLILLVIYLMSGYPLEKPVLALSLFNPIDLGRIFLLLQFDISALMGLTGAVFREFFGTAKGMVIALFTLMLWLAIPLFAGYRRFLARDF